MLRLMGNGRIRTRAPQVKTPRPYPLDHLRSIANLFIFNDSRGGLSYGIFWTTTLESSDPDGSRQIKNSFNIFAVDTPCEQIYSAGERSQSR